MVTEQEPPGAEAEYGGHPGDEDDGARTAPVEPREGLRVRAGALEEQGEREERQYGHGRDPDHEVERVGRGGLAGEDVGDAPEGGGRDHQDEAEHGAVEPLADRRHRDAREGDRHAGDPDAGQSLAEHGRREEGREDRLHLQDEGREAGPHALVHADEEQTELAHAEGESDAHDPLPGDLRAPHEEDRGQRRDQEAQGREEQGREVGEADVDDDEVDPPDCGDQDG
ncbi:hypothetical protein GCM10009612_18190 [Streptomyces beijiangensis]